MADETRTLDTLPLFEKKLLVALLNLGVAYHRRAESGVITECRRVAAMAEFDAGPIKTKRVLTLIQTLHKEEST